MTGVSPLCLRREVVRQEWRDDQIMKKTKEKWIMTSGSCRDLKSHFYEVLWWLSQSYLHRVKTNRPIATVIQVIRDSGLRGSIAVVLSSDRKNESCHNISIKQTTNHCVFYGMQFINSLAKVPFQNRTKWYYYACDDSNVLLAFHCLLSKKTIATIWK